MKKLPKWKAFLLIALALIVAIKWWSVAIKWWRMINA